METHDILRRHARLTCDVGNASGAWVDVHRVGERLLFQTAARILTRSRRLARAGAALGGFAGLALLPFSPWGALLAAAGLAAFLAAPALFRARPLLEIDAAADGDGARFVVRQSAAEAGRTVPLAAVAEIRGVYEIHGWDGRSVIAALLIDGSEVPLLILPGTDERRAADLCRILGFLSGRPATYAGPFGAPVYLCHPPPPDRPRSTRISGTAAATSVRARRLE
jgi:hypothetical protein